MPAPDYAEALLKVNSTWRESKLFFKCSQCKHRGHVSELLCVDDEKTLWCPICKTANMKWED
jgi:rubrerythrin